MSCKRKFRELKTADEEKALLEKSKTRHDMSQSLLVINCLHIQPCTLLVLKPKLPPGFSKGTYITRYKSSHTRDRLARVIGS